MRRPAMSGRRQQSKDMGLALLLLSLDWWGVRSLELRESQTSDYCQSEMFKARCWQNEVVVMTSAMYGRMEIGRCVESDLGYLGCQKDVLHIADRWCSGRRSCDVTVPNKDLDESKPCFSELKTFLRAGYTCVKVAVGKKSYCSSSAHKLKLLSKEGNLASSITDETGCGSPRAPWIIEAMPGQTINFTMVDFDVIPSSTIDHAFSPHHDRCYKYGYVVEPETGTNKTICGGKARHNFLFLSTKNRVEIHILPFAWRRRNGTFIVTYKTIGCPDLNPPEHAFYQRDGSLARIGCRWTEKTWHLKCNNNQWIGVVGNCSGPTPEQAAAKSPEGTFPFSSAVSIVIVIGLAVVIAFIILCIGLLCVVSSRKRKYQRQSDAVLQRKSGACPETQKAMYQAVRPELDNNERDPTNQRLIRQNLVNPVTDVGTGNDYTHIWETPLPEPQSGNMTSDSDYASQSNFSSTTRQSHMTSPYEGIGGHSMASFASSNGERADDNVPGTQRYFVLETDKH